LYKSAARKVSKIVLSEKDKNTRLNDNTRYYVRALKIKDGIADMDETLYVEALQDLRLGKVKPYVKKYLKKLKRAGRGK